MSNATIVTEPRTDFGKGAARKIRRAGKIPAVMYGHGEAPVHITLPGHESMLQLKQSNALLTLEIEGKEQLALAKDVQRNPIKPIIEHVDLLVVRKGEKVVVDVPLHLEGEAITGGVAMLETSSLQVEAEATHIPESFTVTIDKAEIGTQVHAKDVDLPDGVILLTDPDALVVNVAAEAAAVSEEAEEAEEAAEVAGADDAEGSSDAE